MKLQIYVKFFIFTKLIIMAQLSLENSNVKKKELEKKLEDVSAIAVINLFYS